MSNKNPDQKFIDLHVKSRSEKILLTDVSRADLRPQCYTTPPEGDFTYRCCVCREKGVNADLTGSEAFILDGADSKSGHHIYLCHTHLPEDIVIYNPRTNECSDKTGQNTWTEGDPVNPNGLSQDAKPKIIH